MGAVSRLQIILSQLESRLQAFFEGGAARLFSEGEYAMLGQRLVEVMRAEIQPQADGSLLAPNVFTILVHPIQESALSDKDHLLSELAGVLQRTGDEAGFRFFAPLVLRLFADAGLPVGDVQVLAAFSQVTTGDTTALPLAHSPDGIAAGWQDPDSAGADPSRGAFLIVDGLRIVPLTRQGVTIGRRPDMSLVLEDTHVSRVHAQIRLVQGRYVIFDLDSSGGTFVNGQRVAQCVLHPGDVISLAGAQLVFGQDSSSPLDETQKLDIS